MIEMDFDAALKEMKEQDANDKASKAIYRAQGVNPDEYAQDMQLSKQTGLPLETVRRDREFAKKKASAF